MNKIIPIKTIFIKKFDYSITACNDGRLIIIVNDDNKVLLSTWSLSSYKLIRMCNKIMSCSNCLTVIKNDMIIVGGPENLYILNIFIGNVIQTIKGHAMNIYIIEVNYYKNIIASGGDDPFIKIWRLEDWKNIKTLRIFKKYDLWFLDFSRNGQLLLGHHLDIMCIWNLHNGKYFKKNSQK